MFWLISAKLLYSGQLMVATDKPKINIIFLYVKDSNKTMKVMSEFHRLIRDVRNFSVELDNSF